MLKIVISFDEEDREQVLKVVDAAKAIFPGARVRPPEPGKDRKLHMQITGPKR